MMRPLEPPHKRVVRLRLAMICCIFAGVLSACGSVPGETLASGGVRRDITRRVLAQAGTAAPDCKSPRISDTEVVEVHPDGRVAMERWTVEQCGTRAHYRVVFPAAGKAAPVQIRAE